MGNQLVKTISVNGVEVDVYGCWDKETPEGQFDFYDFYVKGECINLGEPYYGDEKDMEEAIAAHLEMHKELGK